MEYAKWDLGLVTKEEVGFYFCVDIELVAEMYFGSVEVWDLAEWNLK